MCFILCHPERSKITFINNIYISKQYLFPFLKTLCDYEYLSVLCLKVSIYKFGRKQLTKLANLHMHSQCALSEPISSSWKTRKLTVCRFI